MLGNFAALDRAVAQYRLLGGVIFKMLDSQSKGRDFDCVECDDR